VSGQSRARGDSSCGEQCRATDQPVYRGFSFPDVFGLEVMNPVDCTVRRICARDSGGSNARWAGTIPNRYRIQAACRASIEWIEMATPRTPFDWINGVLKDRDEGVSSRREDLLAEASTVPPGADGLLFLPYLNGIRTPHVDPHARGSFVGLRLSHSRAHLVRAVLEGVAYAMREALTAFDDLGVDVASLVCSGGGARHALWRQIQADVYGRPLSIVSEEDHSAYGAALLAGIGFGRYESVDAGQLRHLPITGTVEPDPSNLELYDHLYTLYRSLYPALKPVFAGLG